MKGWVAYPYRVKHKGVYYAPGEAVEVDDAEEAVKNGAKPVELKPAPKGRPKKQ